MTSASTTVQVPAFGLPGRIQSPNSRPRSIALVGLGNGGTAVARGVALQDLPRVDVHVLAKSATGGDAIAAIKAGGGDLQRDLMGADMITLRAAVEMLVVVSDESYVPAMIGALGP